MSRRSVDQTADLEPRPMPQPSPPFDVGRDARPIPSSVLRRVTAEFQPYELAEALLALDRYCATHPRDPHGIGGSDELLEAIVHLARGDLNRLRRTIHYARTGPGDILLAAFGRS